MTASTERKWPLISLLVALLVGAAVYLAGPWRQSTLLLVWIGLLWLNVRVWGRLGALTRRMLRLRSWRSGLLCFGREAGLRPALFWQRRRAEGAATAILSAWLTCTHVALHLGPMPWGASVIAALTTHGVLAAYPAMAVASRLHQEETPRAPWERWLLIRILAWCIFKSAQHNGCARRRKEMTAALQQLLDEEERTRR